MEIKAALQDVFENNFVGADYNQISTDAQMRTYVRGIDFFVGFEFVKTAIHQDNLKS